MRRFFGSLRLLFRLATRPDTPLATVLPLLSALLRLEWRVMLERRLPGITVRFRFLGYDVESFSYATLLMLFREIFIAGVYDLPLPMEHPIIVDAGANIGMATLYFLHRHPGGRVWAFEPDPRAFQLLQRNVVRNGLKQVTLVNAALADREGTLPFYYDEAAPELLIMRVHQERLPRSLMMVPCVKLSSAAPPGVLDLVKMDIEGAEGMVAAELVANGRIRDVNRLLLEYHHGIGSVSSQLGDFLTLLENNGFIYSLRAEYVAPGTFQDLAIFAIRGTTDISEVESR